MKKKTKILAGVGIFSTLAAAGNLVSANYFFKVALMRSKNKKQIIHQEDALPLNTSQKEGRKQEIASFHNWVSAILIEDVMIESKDGLKLIARKYKSNPNSHKWSILLHGYVGNNENVTVAAKYFSQEGYNILAPDCRAHGKSEGTYFGLGWLDRLDLKRWIHYIIEQDLEAEIVLYGMSMGGATVMMCAGESLPSNVKVAIEDCGYTSAVDILSQQLKEIYHLPAFPLLDTVNALTISKAKYNLKRANAVEQLKKATIPMFFIHGKEDTFVPFSMMQTLYDACPTQKGMYVVENAGHACSMFEDTDAYFKSIFEFIKEADV